MINHQHHITPPPELLNKLKTEWASLGVSVRGDLGTYLVNNAYSAGADQELEACCKWLEAYDYDEVGRQLAEVMHAARRPKPMSLKKLALLQLDVLNADLFERGLGRDLSQIRRALEQLDD